MNNQSEKKQKNLQRHWLLICCAILAITVTLTFLIQGLRKANTPVPSVIIGKMALPFEVDWIQGRSFLPGAKEKGVSLADFKGKPLVLNFWASWCISCKMEAREFEAFWKTYRDDVHVFGIAIQDQKEAAMEFARRYGKSYMLGLDVDGVAATNYGVIGVPETFFIDREGRIAHKITGPVTMDDLKDQLQKLL